MKRLVLTCAVGPEVQALLAISGPIFAAYAGRIGADYRVIDSPKISPGYPQGAKFQAGQYLRAGWDRLVYFDADILLSPTCPSLFDLVPAGAVGLHDEGKHLGSPAWLEAEYVALCESQSWPAIRPPLNLNTGVIVCSRKHAALFDPPTKPYPASHCAEQSLMNLNARRNGLPVVALPENCNYQRWAHPTTFDTATADVLHFSGMAQLPDGAAARLKAMRGRAAKFGYPAALARELPCVHLGTRSEFRPGCGGRMCRHDCDLGLPAVPGGYCLACPSYATDG